VVYRIRYTTRRLGRGLVVTLEAEVSDEFDNAPPNVDTCDLCVVRSARVIVDLRIRIGEGGMVEEIGCIRGQVEVEPFPKWKCLAE